MTLPQNLTRETSDTPQILNDVKITKISLWQTKLPVVGGKYVMAMGKEITHATSSIIGIETNTGLVGYGEACPLGSNYLPAYSDGILPGLQELAPDLLGLNPLETSVLNYKMDRLLKGHPYIKSPIDVACWDIMGKATGLPVYQLLGGKFQESLPLYYSLSSGPVEEMLSACAQARHEGYKQFQIKCNGNINEDIERIQKICATRQPEEIFIADANQGWSQHEAIRLVNAVKDLDVYIEQPCADLKGCVAIRNHTDLPIKLDESIDSLSALQEALTHNAMDIVCLKISKVGGITKAKQIRDLCAEHNIAMTIEDSWGSDIVTASLAHLAVSTYPQAVLNCSDLNRYMVGNVATGAPDVKTGRMFVSAAPGLGITPNWDLLGDPIFEYN